ncbi:MAG: hypothetical protein E7186_05880 [Erysipelotrichaceae bacterium]|nr:hypothetical protein [Erysipelotrichaceae bacterium]
MAKKDKAQEQNSRQKTELAQRIAENSQRMVNTYASFENTIILMFRRITGLLNKLIFDSKFSKISSLIIAVIIYIAVNGNNSNNVPVSQASQITGIPVQVIYNSEIYEITGVPEKADVIVMGDMTDITLQKSQVNSKLTADLSGLTEGTYTVKLTPTNFISRLSVNVIDAPSITVTIKKKTSTRFNISYEFINTNAMDKIYTLSRPTFDTTEVLIRASQDTIDSIAYVKALIDVSGVTDTFTRDARIVAYNQSGEMVECDCFPEYVSSTVVVTSPNKSVPIIVRPVGNLPDGLAIDKITLDYSTVTLYGTEAVLDEIDGIFIDLDISSISKNTIFSTALTAPSGISKMSVTRVNMEIVVGPAVSKVIEKVETQFVNNTSAYVFAPVNSSDVYMNILVTGTQANIDSVNATNVVPELDLSGITPGTISVPIRVTGSNKYVTYQLEDGRTEIDIVVKEQ